MTLKAMLFSICFTLIQGLSQASASTGISGIYKVSSEIVNEATGKAHTIYQYGFMLQAPQNTAFLHTVAHGACGKNPIVYIGGTRVKPLSVYCDHALDLAVFTMDSSTKGIQYFASPSRQFGFSYQLTSEALADMDARKRILVTKGEWMPLPDDFSLSTAGADQATIRMDSSYERDLQYEGFEGIDQRLLSRISIGAGASGLPVILVEQWNQRPVKLDGFVSALIQEYDHFFSIARSSSTNEMFRALGFAIKGYSHPEGYKGYPVFKYYNGFYKDYGRGIKDISPFMRAAGGERSDGGGERSDGGGERSDGGGERSDGGNKLSVQSSQRSIPGHNYYQELQLAPGVQWLDGQRALGFELPQHKRSFYGDRDAIEYLLRSPALMKQVTLIKPGSDLTPYLKRRMRAAPTINYAKGTKPFLKSKSMEIDSKNNVHVQIEFLGANGAKIAFSLDEQGRWLGRPNPKSSDEFIGIIGVRDEKTGDIYYVDLRSMYFMRLSNIGATDKGEDVNAYIVIRKATEKSMSLIEF